MPSWVRRLALKLIIDHFHAVFKGFVQNDVGNRYSPTVVVAPLTSNIRKNILPTHVHVGRESGVRPSLVLLEQLRTVDKCRLGDKIGHVNKSVMRRVDAAAAISLGLRSLQKDEV